MAPLRFLLALFTLAFVAPARADECDRLPPPSVTLKRFVEPVTLNTQFGYRELTHLGAAIARPGDQVLGLTRGTAVVRVSTRTPSYTDATRRWECASPQLTLSYGFSPMLVYVAKEFPVGSCAYDEIYRHEQRHVSTYQKHLESIEQELSETLNRRFATNRPWRGPAGQTAVQLQQELNERWLPYLKRQIERVDAAQALIDTPAEYARVMNSCQGEVKRGLR
ncbi:hypothetical protein [Rhodocyclus tenuis]|uniref:hypothetical protein n=1 Tax=Rhodocyclus tenuis TaxID=1066 RepID=UPI001908B68E|nr:hypothetical protein [Rhodocyclus tenuis]MBK1681394.1 hypothetical protein [Rhodocyclus tenuis]